MDKNYTDITMVLDASGSMLHLKPDTIGGFNEFLNGQKGGRGYARISLYQFSDAPERIWDNVDANEAKPLTEKEYKCAGNTALLDAIGMAIAQTGDRLHRKPEAERPSKVIVVILTDGQENASRKFTHLQISDMIKHQQDVYKWEFLYIGADQDAISTAATMNIQGSNAINYTKNYVGTQSLYASVSKNVRRARAGGQACFDDADRIAQEQAKK